MKLSSAILLAFVAGTAEAFAPTRSQNSVVFGISAPQRILAEESQLNLFKAAVLAGADIKVEGDAPAASDVSEDTIRSLFYLWNDALATGESAIVAKRYSKEAVLLPTVSDEPRMDFDSIKDYFDAFLLKEPQGEILEGKIHVGDGWAKDAGIYEFTMGATGDKVKARYSYVYIFEGGEWKILHHHSSMMPEEVTPNNAPKLTEDNVKNLFHLWNDALDTLDADAVAARYASKGVLLPTVSDTPRIDYDSIKAYFVEFLKKKPQGKILDSYVTVGPNWAKDVGVYEFTMGVDGSKVKARYSYVYTFEDGEWKILHHHSSAMPEGLMAAAARNTADLPTKGLTERDVQGFFHKWNDALATLDSDVVAKRYAKSAVLLPTVSDTPRTDYDSIKSYFDDFCEKKPRGEIVESYVSIGDHWAKDVGVYEFTMGIDGSKVRARYSYVYTFEDGEWKILHHHSSAMPEGLMAAAAKGAEQPKSKRERLMNSLRRAIRK